VGYPRPKPERLAAKLLAIRRELKLSQIKLARQLEITQYSPRVSAYEHGLREPDLIVLLRYARLANVPLESIVDDEMDLPF